MPLDWKNIDWSAFLRSHVVWGSLVTIIASIAAIAGHSIDPGTQQVLIDNLTKAADALAIVAGAWTLKSRVTAQPEGQTVIIPKKEEPK